LYRRSPVIHKGTATASLSEGRRFVGKRKGASAEQDLSASSQTEVVCLAIDGAGREAAEGRIGTEQVRQEVWGLSRQCRGRNEIENLSFRGECSFAMMWNQSVFTLESQSL
jgi:hypothetical protein